MLEVTTSCCLYFAPGLLLVSSSLNSDTLSAYTMDTSRSPEIGVEAGEPMWKKDPQYSGFRDFVEQCSAQFYPGKLSFGHWTWINHSS